MEAGSIIRGAARGALAIVLGIGVTVPLWSVEAARPSQESERAATRSVWDGVYTTEQARRGQRLFLSQCADCHKPADFKQGYATVNSLFFRQGSACPRARRDPSRRSRSPT